MKTSIYLDNAATTPLNTAAISAMILRVIMRSEGAHV